VTATGGRLLCGAPTASMSGLSTDSRTLEAGELYVPLKGERFDGHAFLTGAAARGAAGCLVARGHSAEVEEFRRATEGAFVVEVADTLRALGDLAAHHIRRSGALVVAVTGSAGKTTTKEMIARILIRTTTRGVAHTPGNYNNLVGLPLTVFAARGDEGFLVLEMGMNSRGEIARLAEISAPDVGVITNVGEAHIGHLGSLEEVGRAKGELFEALGPSAVAVVNEDDPLVRAAHARGCRARRRSFGRHAAATVQVTNEHFEPDGFPRATLVVEGRPVALKLGVLGAHNLLNAAAAVACTLDWCAPHEAVAALESYQGTVNRMQPIAWRGATLLSDCYNASPDTTLAALETLAALPVAGRRVAVLGDMLELGDHSVAAHQRVGRRVAELRFDALFAVGRFASTTVAAAARAGMPQNRLEAVEDGLMLARPLEQLVAEGDWILIKGSRGVKLERLLAALSES